MNGLFNVVSNYANTLWVDNTGNSIMANGDTAMLAVGLYKCGTCADTSRMLYTYDLNGEVKCVEDNASCVLDGENARKGMQVQGTGSAALVLRALTFDKGYSSSGGGAYIYSGATVDLVLLVFSNNRATGSSFGGGAIEVSGSGTTVNVHGSTFIGNTADSGRGDDIFNYYYGTITIHNTCPSPYSSNVPAEGSPLKIHNNLGEIVGGSPFSYSCFSLCDAGSHNPTLGVSSSSCELCPQGSYSSEGGLTCTSCERGKFITSEGATACDDCPAGKYSASLSATSCNTCNPGKYSSQIAAVSEETCFDCEGGKYSESHGATGATDCKSCASGKLNPNPGASHQDACTDCEAGTYSPPASASCPDCPPGNFSSTSGQSNCGACTAGRFSNVTRATNDTVCEACEAGSYSSLEGASSSSACLECPVGKASSTVAAFNVLACHACEAGKYAVQAKSTNCQNCTAGKYSSIIAATSEDTCKSCVFRTFSSTIAANSSDSCLPCEKDSAPLVTEGATTCPKCPSGEVSSSRQTCQEGGARVCKENEYLDQSKCHMCNTNHNIMVLCYFIISLLGVALFIVHVSQSHTYIHSIKTLTTFFQNCEAATLIDLRPNSWPLLTRRVLPFQLPLEDSYCLSTATGIAWNFQHHFYTSLYVPLTIFSILLWLHRKQQKTTARLKIASSLVVLTTIWYTPALRLACSTFDCFEDVEGNRVLSADPSKSCELTSPEYLVMLAHGVAITIFVGIGYPIFIFKALQRKNVEHSDVSNSSSLYFFCWGYKDNHLWFDSFYLAKKAIIVFSTLLPGALAQALSQLVVNLAFLHFLIYKKPQYFSPCIKLMNKGFSNYSFFLISEAMATFFSTIMSVIVLIASFPHSNDSLLRIVYPVMMGMLACFYTLFYLEELQVSECVKNPETISVAAVTQNEKSPKIPYARLSFHDSTNVQHCNRHSLKKILPIVDNGIPRVSSRNWESVLKEEMEARLASNEDGGISRQSSIAAPVPDAPPNTRKDWTKSSRSIAPAPDAPPNTRKDWTKSSRSIAPAPDAPPNTRKDWTKSSRKDWTKSSRPASSTKISNTDEPRHGVKFNNAVEMAKKRLEAQMKKELTEKEKKKNNRRGSAVIMAKKRLEEQLAEKEKVEEEKKRIEAQLKKDLAQKEMKNSKRGSAVARAKSRGLKQLQKELAEKEKVEEEKKRLEATQEKEEGEIFDPVMAIFQMANDEEKKKKEGEQKKEQKEDPKPVLQQDFWKM
jgi:hypothetical protein